MGCCESLCPLSSHPHNAIGRGLSAKGCCVDCPLGTEGGHIYKSENKKPRGGTELMEKDGSCASGDGHLYRTPQIRETFNDKKEKTGLILPPK